MMNEQYLENFYRENLEERIIFALSKRRNITADKAMQLYYNSRLSELIYQGKEGIQYLDYLNLTDILEEELLSGSN